MKKHNVYFEMFGRKMRIEVTAYNAEHAKQQVIDKITFHKIEELEQKSSFNPNDLPESMRDIFNQIFN